MATGGPKVSAGSVAVAEVDTEPQGTAEEIAWATSPAPEETIDYVLSGRLQHEPVVRGDGGLP